MKALSGGWSICTLDYDDALLTSVRLMLKVTGMLARHTTEHAGSREDRTCCPDLGKHVTA